MRIQKKSSFRNVDIDDEGKFDLNKFPIFLQFLTNMDSDLSRVFDNMQGQLSFGAASNLRPGENIFGQWATVADTGLVNTEFIVPHTLNSQNIGIVPGNYFITYTNKGGVVYDSGTTWTTSNIYLKCSAANATLKIFITR